jgi:hypothetical protein
MISHCANPECGVPLRRLRNGRLFQFEVSARELTETPSAEKQLKERQVKTARYVSHFWLCGKCSQHFTLAFDQKSGVTVLPLYAAKSVVSAR